MAHNAVDADQINLGKHLKVRAQGVNLDIHCGPDYIGGWLDDGKGGQNSLGIFMKKGERPYLQCWPEANYGNRLPFAFGPMGLQIPHTDGRVTLLSLKDISELVEGLGRSRPFMNSTPNTEVLSGVQEVPEVHVVGQASQLAGQILETTSKLVGMLVALPADLRTVEFNQLRHILSPAMMQAIEEQIGTHRL